jgi:two-component system response regulator (stage 0 sporulation protein F)
MKKKILVVDDEIGPRESLRILFKDDYDIEVTASGADGLAKIAETPPDLVILDLKMPEMDGIEVLRHIRRSWPAAHVFMLTGYGTPEAARQARDLGVNAYLSKPFDIFELRELVARELA